MLKVDNPRTIYAMHVGLMICLLVSEKTFKHFSHRIQLVFSNSVSIYMLKVCPLMVVIFYARWSHQIILKGDYHEKFALNLLPISE